MKGKISTAINMYILAVVTRDKDSVDTGYDVLVTTGPTT